jgi:hypothetical protein
MRCAISIRRGQPRQQQQHRSARDHDGGAMCERALKTSRNSDTSQWAVLALLCGVMLVPL